MFIMLIIFVICYYMLMCLFMFFFFKQKTAYEMRISDWSSDVCSSDLTMNATCSMFCRYERGLLMLKEKTCLPGPRLLGFGHDDQHTLYIGMKIIKKGILPGAGNSDDDKIGRAHV